MSRKGISPPSRPPRPPFWKMSARRLVIGSFKAFRRPQNLESGPRPRAPRGGRRAPERKPICQEKVRRRHARESPDAGVDSLKKLPPKSREFARPDSLPDAPHGVKEERKV